MIDRCQHPPAPAALSVAVAVALSALAAPDAVRAQSATERAASPAVAADGSPLSDVVVSVNRSEQRSFDAPAAIQSLDARTIREAGAQVNLSESLNRVPGVVVLNRQNYAQDLQLSIRGFGARSTFGIRGVRLLVDGIPASMPDGQGQASTIALGSAQRIEVLRGPLAQMYGNAAGGVVQAFTADGPASPEATASFAAGSNGTTRSGLTAGGQFGSVNGIVDLSRFETDGYRDWSAAKREQLNTKWRWDGGDTKVTLIGNVFSMPYANDPGGLLRSELGDPRRANPNAVTQQAFKAVEQRQLGAVVEHRLGANDTLTARAWTGTRELDNRLSAALGTAGNSATLPRSSGGIVDLDREYSGASGLWQGRRSLGGMPLVVTAGFERERMTDQRRGYLNDAGVQGALKRDEANRAESTGAFAQATWHFAADWAATLGARRSEVRLGVDDRYVVTGNPDDSGKVRFKATSPVAGLTWSVTDTLNVYANLGRGFETPTLSEMAYSSTGATGGPNFGLRASKSRHAELGAKWIPEAGQRVDLAVFDIVVDDEIAAVQNSGGRSVFANVGRTRREGIELSHLARWGRELTTRVALTEQRATYLDAFSSTRTVSGVTTATTVPAGNELPGVPRRFAFGEVAWRPIAVPAASVALEVVHGAGLWANDVNDERAAGWTVANLRAGLAQEVAGWRFTQFARIDNATDRRYVGSVIVNDANRRYYEPAPGRSWLVGVSGTYRF